MLKLLCALIFLFSIFTEASADIKASINQCKVEEKCPSSIDLYQSDKVFKASIDNVLKIHSIDLPEWFIDGFSSVVIPVYIEDFGRKNLALLGGWCKQQDCRRDSASYIYYPRSKKSVVLVKSLGSEPVALSDKPKSMPSKTEMSILLLKADGKLDFSHKFLTLSFSPSGSEYKKNEKPAKEISSKDEYRLNYIRKISSKYSRSIIAENLDAYRIIRDYNIDCKTKDGRVVPLLNALYVSAAELDAYGGEMQFHIKKRGYETRVYSIVLKNSKQTGSPELYMIINGFGDLQPIGMSSEALLNLCFGSHGDVWIMPGEQGY